MAAVLNDTTVYAIDPSNCYCNECGIGEYIHLYQLRENPEFIIPVIDGLVGWNLTAQRVSLAFEDGNTYVEITEAYADTYTINVTDIEGFNYKKFAKFAKRATPRLP